MTMNKRKKQKFTIKGTVHSKYVNANFSFDTERFASIVLFAVLCIVIVPIILYLLNQLVFPSSTIPSA